MNKNDREMSACLLFGILAVLALLVFPTQSMYRDLATIKAAATVQVAKEINEGLSSLAKALVGDCDCVQTTDEE